MGNVSVNQFIDRRIQVRLKQAKEQDWTSIIVLSKDIEDKKLVKEFNRHNARIKYKLDIIKAYAVEFPCKCIENLALMPEVDFIADDATLSTLMDIARPTIGGNKADQYNL